MNVDLIKPKSVLPDRSVDSAIGGAAGDVAHGSITAAVAHLDQQINDDLFKEYRRSFENATQDIGFQSGRQLLHRLVQRCLRGIALWLRGGLAPPLAVRRIIGQDGHVDALWCRLQQAFAVLRQSVDTSPDPHHQAGAFHVDGRPTHVVGEFDVRPPGVLSRRSSGLNSSAEATRARTSDNGVVAPSASVFRTGSIRD